MEEEEKEMRDWLVELYHEKGMSFPQIERETDIPYTSLHRMFKKYGIAKRDSKQAVKLWWKGRKKNAIH